MKQQKTLLVLVLAFVLLIGGASVLYRHLGQNMETDQLAAQSSPQAADGTQDSPQQPDEETPEPPKAPDFVVYDAEGGEVRLSDYIGKPIVLNFWASWCGPCQMEMPDFHDKYLELGEDVHFLMINMTGGRETMNSAVSFIEENSYTFPVFYDTDYDAASTYGAYSLPMTFFIDADGYAIAQASSAIDAETLQIGIDMIL